MIRKNSLEPARPFGGLNGWTGFAMSEVRTDCKRTAKPTEERYERRFASRLRMEQGWCKLWCRVFGTACSYVLTQGFGGFFALVTVALAKVTA